MGQEEKFPVVLVGEGGPVSAELVRDLDQGRLPEIETDWRAFGRAGESSHWDWRNKVGSTRHRFLAVQCDGQCQGLLAVLAKPRPSRLADAETVLYLDFFEAAPWNLPAAGRGQRFRGTGFALFAEAVRLSWAGGSGGRLGLHSLLGVEGFYRIKCGMTDLGQDPHYYDLRYFESTPTQIQEWYTKEVGEWPPT